MKRGELRHDLCAIMFLTDHVIMMPKYQGKIPVGDKRSGTEAIYKTYEDLSAGLVTVSGTFWRGASSRYSLLSPA